MTLGQQIYNFYLDNEEEIKKKEKKKLLIEGFCKKINDIHDFKNLSYKSKDLDSWICCLNFFIVKKYELLGEFKKKLDPKIRDDLFIKAFTKRKIIAFLNSYSLMIQFDKAQLIDEILEQLSEDAKEKIKTKIRPSMIIYSKKDINLETIEYYFSNIFHLSMHKESISHNIISLVKYRFKDLNKEDSLKLSLSLFKLYLTSKMKHSSTKEDLDDYYHLLSDIIYRFFEFSLYFGLRLELLGFSFECFEHFMADIEEEYKIPKNVLLELRYKLIKNHLVIFNDSFLRMKLLMSNENLSEEGFYFKGTLDRCDFENYFDEHDFYRNKIHKLLSFTLESNILDKFIEEKQQNYLLDLFIQLGDLNLFKDLDKKINAKNILTTMDHNSFMNNDNKFDSINLLNIYDKNILLYMLKKGIEFNFIYYKHESINNNRVKLLKIKNILDLLGDKLSYSDFIKNLEKTIKEYREDRMIPEYLIYASYGQHISTEHLQISAYEYLSNFNLEELTRIKKIEMEEEGLITIKDIDFFIEKNKESKTIERIEGIFND